MSLALSQFLERHGDDGMAFELNPSQAKFLMDWNRWLAFFGGVGNGKTTIACLKCIIIMETFSYSRGLVGRKYWPDLEATTMDEFFNVCPPELIDPKGTRKSQGTPQCRFKNGSVVLFRHFHESGTSRVSHRKTGGNFNFVYIDQAEELDRATMQTIRGRMRRIVKDNKGRTCPQQIMLTGNPAGHNFVWQDFINQKLPDHTMIEATSLENKRNLPKDFVRDLLNAPKIWRDRYVFGSWDDYEGLIFDTISRRTHEVDAFEVPPSWDRYRVIDYGMNAPTVCEWWAVDNDGNCFMYDCYYEPGLTVRQHTENIMRKSADIGDRTIGYVTTIYDPSCFFKTLQDEERGFYSPYDEFTLQSALIANRYPELEDMSMWGIGGDNNFSAGVARVRDYGFIDPEHLHPITGEKGAPHVFFMKGKCEPFWTEHGDYTWLLPKGGVDFIGAGTVGKEVADPKKADHAMDCIRYFLMHMPMLVIAVPVPETKGRSVDHWHYHRQQTVGRGFMVA